MPFYEYQCTECGHTLEEMEKITAAPLKICPECGKPALQRLMSAPVFRLKGAGWYETDFKTEQDGKRNLADRPEAPAPQDKDDKKDEKKDVKEDVKEGAPQGKDGAKGPDKPADKPAEKSVKEAPSAPAAAATGKKAVSAKHSKRRAAPSAKPVPARGRHKKPVKKARP
jgi:putative FmdB family regulatory protein